MKTFRTQYLLLIGAIVACGLYLFTSLLPIITELNQYQGIRTEQVLMPDGEYITCAVHDGYREASLDCPDILLQKHGLVPDQ